MTPSISRFVHFCLTSIPSIASQCGLLLFTALLVACGPGTGGTGVGPINASAFSGTYLSAANSFAVSAPASLAGLGLVVTPSRESNWVLMFDAQRVTLNNACLTFNAEGLRVESSGQLQIEGQFRVVASGAGTMAALPATLIAKVDGAGLQVTLRTAEGTVLAEFGTGARLGDGVNPSVAGTCVASVLPT